MKSEDKDIKRRLLDLANRSYQNGVYTFTDFLTLAEQNILYEMENELAFAHFELFGGGEACERQVVRFGDPEQLGYDEEYPIACIHIKPLLKKFAEDLTHRDFLGALMNLGVKREVLGDIIVKDSSCHVFCLDSMANFICDELTRVRHTSVACCVLDANEVVDAFAPTLRGEEHIVGSARCDAVVAKVFALSRSSATELFRGKCVYVNGRIYENNSGTLRAGAVVSVRGYGKFVYGGEVATTKKGKLLVRIERYI